jgi:hypothetical protein
MIFWIHRGLQFPTFPALDKHCAHLNMEGNYEFATSPRGAVCTQENYGKMFLDVELYRLEPPI